MVLLPPSVTVAIAPEFTFQLIVAPSTKACVVFAGLVRVLPVIVALATLPVRLPVTLPVTLPTTFPVRLPVNPADALTVVNTPAFPTTIDTRSKTRDVVPIIGGVVEQESLYRDSALVVPSLTRTMVPSTASRLPSKSVVRVQAPVDAR